MKRVPTSWILSIVIFVSTAIAAYSYYEHLEYVEMHTMPAGLREFDVKNPPPVCGRWKDHMPKFRNPDVYRSYLAARKFYRSKIEFQFTGEELRNIFHSVEQAAFKGDWGARALLSYFYAYGLGPFDYNHILDADANKSVEIVRTAVAAGQAWGFYDLGVAYENGYGGVPYDKTIAWAYYLRAAELGSPEAQMVLAEAYESAKRMDIGQEMLLCAFRQGHGPAARRLGSIAAVTRRYADAIAYNHAGVTFGCKECAWSLRCLFDASDWRVRDRAENDALRTMGFAPDTARVERYDAISNALGLNPDLRFTRLDRVLPLPPADLPDWKGIEDALEPETDAPPTY